MVSVILSGGLGNQMFQFATAKALSIRCKTNLSIDLYAINKNTKATSRNYSLDIFEIDTPIKSSIRNKIAIKGHRYLLKNKLGEYILKNLGIFRDRKAQFFEASFNNLTGNTSLFGYFQNEQYFSDITSALKQDFRFRNPLKDKNAEIAEIIKSTQSVSIHIRRGDYLSSNSNLAPLDIEYYKQAISLICQKIGNPTFFVFSDDINWAKQHLQLEAYPQHFIDWNQADESYMDMQLMSLCKHNVIANSSFSWWGAWLNNNANKMVIAPPVWYKSDKQEAYPKGFFPDNWIVI